MKKATGARALAVGFAALAIGALVVSPAIGGPSLNQLVSKEVSKQMNSASTSKKGKRGPRGPAGPQGPQGAQGIPGPPGSPAAKAFGRINVAADGTATLAAGSVGILGAAEDNDDAGFVCVDLAQAPTAAVATTTAQGGIGAERIFATATAQTAPDCEVFIALYDSPTGGLTPGTGGVGVNLVAF